MFALHEKILHYRYKMGQGKELRLIIKIFVCPFRDVVTLLGTITYPIPAGDFPNFPRWGKPQWKLEFSGQAPGVRGGDAGDGKERTTFGE